MASGVGIAGAGCRGRGTRPRQPRPAIDNPRPCPSRPLRFCVRASSPTGGRVARKGEQQPVRALEQPALLLDREPPERRPVVARVDVHGLLVGGGAASRGWRTRRARRRRPPGARTPRASRPRRRRRLGVQRLLAGLADARGEVAGVDDPERVAREPFERESGVVLVAEVPAVEHAASQRRRSRRAAKPAPVDRPSAIGRGPARSATSDSCRCSTSTRMSAAKGTSVTPRIVYRASPYWRAARRTTRKSTIRSKRTE